jgi:isoquinoline 1-oxidoreductase beta subunit
MKNLLFNSDSFSQDRRNFLKVTAAVSGGLLLEMSIPGFSMDETSWQPNAFLRIDQDSTVTVIIKHLEMGQGTYTGLATLVAEELDANWEQIRVEAAPANAKLYKNLLWGTQGTGGSTAIANAFQQMRKAGATARQMLVAAAATHSHKIAEIS